MQFVNSVNNSLNSYVSAGAVPAAGHRRIHRPGPLAHPAGLADPCGMLELRCLAVLLVLVTTAACRNSSGEASAGTGTERAEAGSPAAEGARSGPGAGQANDDPYPEGALGLVRDGQKIGSWSMTHLERVATEQVRGDGGSMREAWPLRALAADLLGPDARVTAAIGDDGERLEITTAAWADEARAPMLRRNRRGMFKLEWVGAGASADDHLRGVRALEVAP